MSGTDEDRSAKAETEFDAYLRLVKAGEKPSFEDFCRERPHLEDALKFLYSLHFRDSAAAAASRESVGFTLQRVDGFPSVEDRNELWRLLLWITASKARNLRRDIQGRPALDVDAPDSDELIADPRRFADSVSSEFAHLLERLDDRELQEIAVAKMARYTNKQIAEKIGCAVKTIERRLKLIRRKWERELTQ